MSEGTRRGAGWAARREGLLVAVEGIDGTGKTTLLRTLSRRLRARGWALTRWKEPSDSKLGKAARAASGRDPAEAALLFTLDRGSQRGRLERLLARTDLVLSDRSFYSTLAYQGSVLPPRELRSLELLQRLMAREPDLVLWLDLPTGEALRRVGGRGSERSPLERREVLERTARAYAAYARRERRRFVRIDARAAPEEIAESAAAEVEARLRTKARPPSSRPPRRKSL